MVDLDQGRDFWNALVNTALNLRVLLAMELVKRTEMIPIGRPRCRWGTILEWILKK